MSSIEDEYQRLCATPSDIHEHLPVLRRYADLCEHVTEFGVRSCISLHALLVSKAKQVVAYDIANVNVPESDKLTFINADVLSVDIEPTDMLHIDSRHTFEQLSQELFWHADVVKKFIAMHDVVTFGENGEDGSTPGLNAAIAEFLRVNPHWQSCYHSAANNGMTILERTT